MINRIKLLNRSYSITFFWLLNFLLILIIGYQLSHSTNRYLKASFNIIVDPSIYPVSAVNFLKENAIKGNILLPFEWGEYVIWKLYPDCKVSIDGRFRTSYPESVINDHFILLDNPERYKEILDKYPTDILLMRRNAVSQRLLSDKKDWVYIYSDKFSFIFIKDSNKMQEYLEKAKRKEIIYLNKELSIYFP
ncbi:hypothetical protein ACFL1Z_00215 [Thermodesulfobacteriota bacterium]